MKYQIQEGSLNVPDDAGDESVNIIKFSDRQAVLVITRARLEPGQTLEGYYDQQIAQIKHAVKNFLVDEKTAVVLNSADKARRSYQTRCEFDQKGLRMRQCLLFTGSQGRLLVMTYSQPRALTEADLAHWQGMTDSLILTD